jgi:hypothetical protein
LRNIISNSLIYNIDNRSRGQIESDRGLILSDLIGSLDDVSLISNLFVTAFIGAGILLVAVSYITCEHRTVAVVVLSLAVMFNGLCKAGYYVNHVDFAPK